jgi:hypothetical protein
VILTAVFGIVGVIVGAIVTGGTQLFIDWRKEQRAVARAKRLVAGELLQARLILRTLHRLQRWPSPDVLALLSTDVWQQHNFYLSLLDPTVWDNLVGLYAEFATMWVVANAFTAGDAIQADMLATMKSTDEHLAAIRQQLGAQEVPWQAFLD